jgi:hypothetical protein
MEIVALLLLPLTIVIALVTVLSAHCHRSARRLIARSASFPHWIHRHHVDSTSG